jgi:hypothetical protein
MPRHVATFRAVFDAENDVHAAVIADQIRVNGSEDLDLEEGDTFECTQVTSNQLELLPDELFNQLNRCRNLLIKTRIKECFNLARELDMQIYALRYRDSPDFTMSGYSYGDFMDLVESIITRGEEPNV